MCVLELLRVRLEAINSRTEFLNLRYERELCASELLDARPDASNVRLRCLQLLNLRCDRALPAIRSHRLAPASFETLEPAMRRRAARP